MAARVVYPFGRLRIAYLVKKPAQEGKSVTLTEAEPRGEGAEGVRKRARVFLAATNSIRDYLGYRLRLLSVEKQVRSDS